MIMVNSIIEYKCLIKIVIEIIQICNTKYYIFFSNISINFKVVNKFISNIYSKIVFLDIFQSYFWS